jgi:hypothetical protein
MLTEINKALRPDGMLILIDFTSIEGVSHAAAAVKAIAQP